jgi:hypothetical protein
MNLLILPFFFLFPTIPPQAPHSKFVCFETSGTKFVTAYRGDWGMMEKKELIMPMGLGEYKERGGNRTLSLSLVLERERDRHRSGSVGTNGSESNRAKKDTDKALDQ